MENNNYNDNNFDYDEIKKEQMKYKIKKKFRK